VRPLGAPSGAEKGIRVGEQGDHLGLVSQTGGKGNGRWKLDITLANRVQDSARVGIS
jgi:hypothetical protein